MEKKGLDDEKRKLRRKTIHKLRRHYGLKTRKQILRALSKMIDMNVELVLYSQELTYYIDLLTKLDHEQNEDTPEKQQSYIS